MPDASEIFVSTDWLGRNLGRAGLKILDGSWHMPALKRDIRADFAACHIPGARLCDVDEVAAPDTAPLPHMAPDEATFAAKIGALGIGDGDTVVVYDSAGIATAAARVWWLFRLFGFDRVAVLDGGLPKWLAEGRPTESGEAAPVQPAAFTARKRPELIRSADQVLANIDAAKQKAADAAETARRTTVLAAFLTAASLLVAAAAAYWAASMGGRHRDEQTVFADFFRRY